MSRDETEEEKPYNVGVRRAGGAGKEEKLESL